MNRLYRFIIFSAVIFAVSLPAFSRAAAPVYPEGLRGPSSLLGGVYASTDRGGCCWMTADARFLVPVPKGANTLIVRLFIPGYALHGRESFRVKIGAAPWQRRCCFGPGMHELPFTMSSVARRARNIIVQVKAAQTFVPARVRLNSDDRRLSALLRGVSFVNTVTGERFGAGGGSSYPDFDTLPLLLAAGAAILALTLWRPVYGVAALMLSDPFLFPYDLHGTTVTLPKVALVAVLLGIIIGRKWPRDLAAPALWVLLGAQLFLALSMVLSLPHAVHRGPALRETFKAVEYVMVLVTVYTAYRSDPDEGVLRWTACLALIAVSLLALSQEVTGAPQGEMIAGYAIPRIAGPLDGPNQLAGYLGVLVPMVAGFAVSRGGRVIELSALAAGIMTCLLTFSRGGIGALALGVGLVLLARYRPSRLAAAIVALAASFAVLFGTAAAAFAGNVHGAAQALLGSSAGDRFNGGLGLRSDLWHAAYKLWRSHPMFGIGPGNFEYAVSKYDPGVRTHANSIYFQSLAEQGVLGLAATITVSIVGVGIFLRRLNAPLTIGAFGAAVAMAFHQLVDCMWVYPKVGMIWWVLLALGAASMAGTGRRTRSAV